MLLIIRYFLLDISKEFEIVTPSKPRQYFEGHLNEKHDRTSTAKCVWRPEGQVSSELFLRVDLIQLSRPYFFITS